MEKEQKVKKKVCIITTVHPPFDIRIFHKQAKTLLGFGYDVSLIATHNKEETIDGIKLIPLSTPENRFERMFLNNCKSLLLALKQNASIYHFHDPELLFVGLLLKVIFKKKVIYDSHEFYRELILYKEWIPKPYRIFYSKFFTFYEKSIYPKLDAVIGVLNEQAYLFPKVEYVALYNLPQKTMFENLNIKEKKYDLIYAGTLSRDRGLFEMLKIAKILKHQFKMTNLKFVLIGKFASKELEEEYNQYLKTYSLKDNIYFRGFKPYHESINLIAKSRLGLNLAEKSKNYDDSKPILATKIFEYMALKVPVFVTDFKCTMEFLNTPDYIYFVKNGEELKTAELIFNLLNNPEKLMFLGDKARNEFLEKYNWETESEKLFNLYEKLFVLR
ncbi:MAG: glycosyltransferase [Cyanobacteriota bacterium]